MFVTRLRVVTRHLIDCTNPAVTDKEDWIWTEDGLGEDTEPVPRGVTLGFGRRCSDSVWHTEGIVQQRDYSVRHCWDTGETDRDCCSV